MCFAYALNTTRSVPCNLIEDECFAYGSQDKFNQTIKWPDQDNQAKFWQPNLHTDSNGEEVIFEMNQEDFDNFWP